MKLRPVIQFLALTLALVWLGLALIVSDHAAKNHWSEIMATDDMPGMTDFTQAAAPYVFGGGCSLSLIGLALALRRKSQPLLLDVLFAVITVAVLAFTGMHALAAFLPSIKIIAPIPS